MTLSTTAIRTLQRTDDPFGLLMLLTITGDGLGDTIRLVSDTRDCTSRGQVYLGLPFAWTLPEEAAGEVGRAQVQIDNVGRELTAELERLPPGAELVATLEVVCRATPDVVDMSFTAPMSGLQATPLSITATVGEGDLMRLPAVDVRFDPFTAPGLFAG